MSLLSMRNPCRLLIVVALLALSCRAALAQPPSTPKADALADLSLDDMPGLLGDEPPAPKPAAAPAKKPAEKAKPAATPNLSVDSPAKSAAALPDLSLDELPGLVGEEPAEPAAKPASESAKKATGVPNLSLDDEPALVNDKPAKKAAIPKMELEKKAPKKTPAKPAKKAEAEEEAFDDFETVDENLWR